EVADQSGREQPLPIVGRGVAGNLLLSPVNTQHFAESGIGTGDRQLVDVLARTKSGNSENAVELVKPDQAVDDRLGGSKFNHPRAAGRGLAADLGPDQSLGLGSDLLEAGMQHLADLRDAGLS